jgi:GTP cyclohydrolase I
MYIQTEAENVLQNSQISEILQNTKENFDANGNRTLSEVEREDMIVQLETKFSEVLDILRMSKEDPNLTYTPRRMAKMYVNELLSGRFTESPKITVFPNRNNVNNLVISKGIKVMSMCSHHWQVISGHCTIGYIPDKNVVGISKLTRIVDWFCRRAQIQEELGEQIADYIEDLLHPQALGVVINAKHYCMIARGVSAGEEDSVMVTSVVRGLMMDDATLRNEFMKLID